jgi:ABC-type multidrug transport system ATPase subunit
VPNPPSLPQSAVSIRGLTKVYASSNGTAQPKKALDQVDLEIPRGSLFALLGPNGAGKSTLINILAQLVIKTSGTVTVWDIDLDRDPRHAAAAIGIVPQELNIDPFFTPAQLLDIQAGMYGVPKAERRTDELLRALALSDKAGSYARTLSGGMRRRLMVAKAMVHNPPVLVLDEPTAGVDVELRQQLWGYVHELNRSHRHHQPRQGDRLREQGAAAGAGGQQGAGADAGARHRGGAGEPEALAGRRRRAAPAEAALPAVGDQGLGHPRPGAREPAGNRRPHHGRDRPRGHLPAADAPGAFG